MNSLLTKSSIDKLSFKIIGACIEVHKALGPGLLENVYHKCLKEEFTLRNINYNSEHPVQIRYKGAKLESNLRCDFIIENCIVLELKAVEAMAPVFYSQTLTYMKLLEAPKGILINFNVKNIFNEGQKTLVNEIYKAMPM